MKAEKICGIYQIRNIINNKKIIGQSVDIRGRWISHKNRLRRGIHINKHLQRAWNKYGENNFKFEFLYLCPSTDLNKEEIRLIKEHNTFDKNFGYNLTTGGESPVMSEETKEKIRQSCMGEKHTLFGKHRSEETKQRIREALSGENCYNYGKHLSEETKQKISDDHKGENNFFYGKKHTKESLARMIAAHKGKPLSEEHRQKLSKIRKGKPISEETKQKIRESKLGKPRSEETKRKKFGSL